jgi:hypothetical protein
MFLNIIKNGIKICNIVYHRPTVIYRSNAFSFGLDRYNKITGMVWQFELPTECRFRFSLHSPEFQSFLHVRFLYRLIFLPIRLPMDPAYQVKLIVPLPTVSFTNKQLASIVVQAESCLYSQLLDGEWNEVSDWLLHDFHLSNTSVALSSEPCTIWLTCPLLNQLFK